MEVRFFDESKSDERNTCLIPTNEINDIEIVGVNWSHPQGSFQVNGETTVTHLIATFNNRPFIYKVTNYRVINKTVIEYYYDIDYMKTYFYINQWNKLQSARINRSCNPKHWNRYLPDERWEVKEPYSITQNGEALNNYVFMLVMNNPLATSNEMDGGKDVYFLTDSGLDKLQKFLLEDKKASLCMSQIYGVFVLPCTSAGFLLAPTIWGFKTEYHTIVFRATKITYEGEVIEYSHRVDGLDASNCQRVTEFNTNYRSQWSSGITVSTNDFRDIAPIKTRILHVPYIGDINVPENMYEWSDLTDPHTQPHTFEIGASYWLNPYEGTISACLNKDVGVTTVDYLETKTPYHSLPRVALAVADVAVTADIAYTNMNLAKTNNEINTYGATLNSVATGAMLGTMGFSKNVLSTPNQILDERYKAENFGGTMGLGGVIASGAMGGIVGALPSVMGSAIGAINAQTKGELNDNQISTSYRNQVLSATSQGYTMTTSEGYESFQDTQFRLVTMIASPVNDFDKFMLSYGYLSLLIVRETTTEDGYKMWLTTNDCEVNLELEYALYDIQRRYIIGNFGSGLWLDGSGNEHNTHRPSHIHNVEFDPNSVSASIASIGTGLITTEGIGQGSQGNVVYDIFCDNGLISSKATSSNTLTKNSLSGTFIAPKTTVYTVNIMGYIKPNSNYEGTVNSPLFLTRFVNGGGGIGFNNNEALPFTINDEGFRMYNYSETFQANVGDSIKLQNDINGIWNESGIASEFYFAINCSYVD